MSDQIPATPETTSAPPRSGRLARLAVILALGLGLVGAGAVATSSFSQGFGSPFGHGHGPGFGHGPGHWRGGPFGGGFDPARAEERADRMIRHISVEVDATAEQQEKLRGVVKNAVKDMVPMREKLFAARKQARDLLLAQNIDRAAIEKLRAEQLAVADTLSKRFTQALIDAAEVLNPDQRHKLEEILPPAGRWRGWSRG